MYYLVNQQHDYTVRGYLQSPRSQDLSCSIRLLYYRQLRKLHELPSGTYIFSDHERLSPNQTRLAVSLWNQLAGKPGMRLLNNPSLVWRRYELLRRLFELGRNQFNVYRLDEPRSQIRFPVFVREEREHNGSLTELIHSPGELDKELQRLLSPLQKYQPDDLLIVEFCDVRNSDGIFVKYSAARIGDRILSRYLQTSKDWKIKLANSIVDKDSRALECDFIRSNPYEDRVREIFDLAHIDYGRLDYGLLGDQLQVWEINTNPMMAGMPANKGEPEVAMARTALLEPGRRLFHQAMRDAFEVIESPAQDHQPIPLSFPDSTVRAIRREELQIQLRRPMRWIKRHLRSLQ